ncbi:FAD-binding monooxygenase [Microbacterium marinilacus]|uniref:FAD-binding monooxygenase n=1 Tax=Microbacterium marinilacus TaxID=415209 RepID=UPI001C8E8692|nr:FAD-binding monooxygenase [Microbacterium marinilacus]MBY0687144.1 FAD-binding monooxygenase [Microbacterium marinilacus]
MQFHHHGYVSGDPRVQPAAGVGLRHEADGGMGDLPAETDVLIVGAGPAGMIAAAQLAQFPGIAVRLVDRRPGRLEVGQADGIQARSVETFQAFGFANRIVEEAYRITEMCFWKPDPENPRDIVRAARTPDDPHGISEFPHLIVNQARVLDYFAEYARHAPGRLAPDWGWEFRTLRVEGSGEFPVVVTLRRASGAGPAGGAAEGDERVIRAKYVIGADGARSRVREAIGRRLEGDQAFHAWGVMDVLAETDFPDIRTKCAIQSHDGGSILLIPREGNHLFRMYVDLGEVSPDDAGRVRLTTQEQVEARANRILHPYTLTVRHVAWRSVYEVAHRVTDRFDDVAPDDVGSRSPRVFIAGDACHTHSAKAGQGMNVSMQDGWNIAWKLAHVLDGRAPETLLDTYSAERHEIAVDLIEFDREWSALMARRPEDMDDPSQLEDFYLRTIEFPAGFMTRYRPSMLVAGDEHQGLATGFPVGRRFTSHPVVRVCDANPKHLGHHHRADGRWRIYAFADADGASSGSRLSRLADWIASDPGSPVVAHTPEGADADAWFDLKVVYQEDHTRIEMDRVPAAFLPRTGPFQVVDYEKVYAADPRDDVFEARGVSRDGAIVVVRPDQYVSAVLPLTATDELAAFFAGVLRPQPATA